MLRSLLDGDFQVADAAVPFLSHDAGNALTVRQRLLHVRAAPQEFTYHDDLLPVARGGRATGSGMCLRRPGHRLYPISPLAGPGQFDTRRGLLPVRSLFPVDYPPPPPGGGPSASLARCH